MAGPPGPGSRLRVGLIGCGYWGEKLLRNFSANPDCDLVAVADPDPARLADAASQAPAVVAHEDARALVAAEDVDAVVIATPVSTHFPLAAEALERGKHVLVEKPLARSSEEASRLIELAEQHDRVLMVDHTFLYSGAVRAVREVVADGALGRLLFVDSARQNFGTFQSDVNVVDDLGPHDFSILEYLVGGGARSLSATGITPAPSEGQIPVSAAYVQAEFAEGLRAQLALSWMSPVKVRRTLICGSERMLLYDDTAPDEPVRVFDWSLRVENGADLTRVIAECDQERYYAPPIDPIEPLARMAGEFVDCASSGRRPLTDGPAGLRVVQLLEAARSSLAAGGRTVTLNGS